MEKEFLEELFKPFGNVTIHRMFGGMAIFHRSLNFAAIMDGGLRLKADSETIADFEAEGMAPWEYVRKDSKVTVMHYWQVP